MVGRISSIIGFFTWGYITDGIQLGRPVAVIFLANSLLLAYLASEEIKDVPESLLDTSAAVQDQQVLTEEVVPTTEDVDEYEGRDQSVPDLPVE